MLCLLLTTLLHAQSTPAGLKPPLPGAGEPPPAGAVPPAGGLLPEGAGKGPPPGGKPPEAAALGQDRPPLPGGPGAPADGSPATPRAAEARRVISRVAVTGASSVTLLASASDGTSVTLILNDAGTEPDARKGDGEFSGDGLLPADTVTLSVKVDGRTIDAGTASWDATATLRVLDVKVDGASATATAGVGERKAPGGAEAGSAPATADGRPPAEPPLARGPDGGVATTWSGIAFPAAILVGLVAAGALIGLLPRRGATLSVSGLTPVRGAGLLGPGTPTFEDGCRTWGVAAEDRPRFLGVLVDALARYHPVVLATADGTEVPAPAGGAVFRSAGAPSAVLESARGLATPGRPTVVIAVPPVGEAAGAWPERAPGCEILVVTSPLAEGADVVVLRDGDGWRIRSRQGDARI